MCGKSQIKWVSHSELIRLSSVLLSCSGLEVLNIAEKLYANALSLRFKCTKINAYTYADKAEVPKNLDGDWSICSKPHFGSEFFTCLR